MLYTIPTLLAALVVCCVLRLFRCALFSFFPLFRFFMMNHTHTHKLKHTHILALPHSCPITANTCQSGVTMTPTKTGQKAEQDARRGKARRGERRRAKTDWRNDDPDLAKSFWVSKAALDSSDCGLAHIHMQMQLSTLVRGQAGLMHI